MRDVAITAVGQDRPGIVAGVTGVLYDLGCNLADCSMSLLRDQFAMILLVEAPEDLDDAAIDERLGEVAQRLGLVLQVAPAGMREPTPSERSYVVSVYGPDRPGIVHGISKVLAGSDVNITNLVSHLVDESLYTTVLDVDLPAGLDASVLEVALEEEARTLGVDVSIRPREAPSL
jgi:glycine cleavage system transcriptional repressor